MILEQNYRCTYGEIDAIGLAPDDYLIFVEIKYRRSGRSGDALESVNVRKTADNFKGGGELSEKKI